MPRAKQGMTWFKVFSQGWLSGSIRYQLDPAERGVWCDLLALASRCSMQGAICDNDQSAFPRDYIASQLNIPRKLLDRTIDKCITAKRLVDNHGILIVSNWRHYQSEYERQKPYRNRNTDPPDPPSKF